MTEEGETTGVNERSALERLLLAHLNEQRTTRRWGVFFKLIGVVWLFLVFFMLAGAVRRRVRLDQAAYRAGRCSRRDRQR
jgi:hypothetical protein